jgi:hypothetical protein
MAVEEWLTRIAGYDKEFAKWEKRGREILDRYIDKRELKTDGARFNILWSNVQTLTGAVYSRVPKPEVTRRFNDKDEVARVAGLILERCLEFETEQYSDFRESLRYAVQDRFLPGRGVVWVRYEPEIVTDPAEPENDDGAQISSSQDEPDEGSERIDWETSPVDYVHWTDFGHVIAKTWDEVPAAWRRVYMTKDAVKKRFPGFESRLQYTAKSDYNYTDDEGRPDKACIYEIWDKDSGRVLWLSKGVDEYLDERADPLGLHSFFPCPRPLFATLTTDSLVPVPDFAVYQDQARELDTICTRIDGLVDSLKVIGVYDATQKQLQRLFKEAGNTQMVPVDTWAMFAEKGGLRGTIEWVPLDQIVVALGQLYEARQQVQSQIYEITGLSDIIRGASQASETATAQQIKSQYASLRLKTMQDAVAVFATEVLRIKAQVICLHYQPETILQMSAAEQMGENPELIGAAMAMLKQDPLMTFRIEIAADSLVMIDEKEQQEQRVQFLTAAGGFLEKAMQAVQVSPGMAPLLGEMLLFGVRGFKVGRQIEGKFDAYIQQLTSEPAQPKPDPEAQKMQAQQQAEQARMQAEAQKMQMEMQIKAQEFQGNQQTEAQRLQLEQTKMQMEQERAAAKLQMESEREAARIEFDQFKAELEATLRREEIAAKERAEQMKADIELVIARDRLVAESNRFDGQTVERTQIAGPETDTKPAPTVNLFAGGGDDGMALSAVTQAMNQIQSAMTQFAQAATADKVPERDENGQIVRVRTVQ